MMARREDYMRAGLRYFPLTLQDKTIVGMLFGLSVLLYLAAMLIYRFGSFGLLYLVVANILSTLMLYANARLVFRTESSAAWRVYKLSAFPYLGIIFLAMSLDVFLIRT
jgi:heme O synthase-like polyprenyltransferase